MTRSFPSSVTNPATNPRRQRGFGFSLRTNFQHHALIGIVSEHLTPVHIYKSMPISRASAMHSQLVNHSNDSHSTITPATKSTNAFRVRRRRSRQVMIGGSDLVQTVSDAIYNASFARTSTESSVSSLTSAQENGPIPERGAVLSRLSDSNTSARKNAQDLQQGPRFTNKPNGTPLGTILEQHSSYTLQSRCSNKTLTINSYRLPGSKNQVLVEFQPGPVHRVRSRSLDERGLTRIRRIRTILDSEIDRLRKSSDTIDGTTPAPAEPAQPPYPQPQRPTTPVCSVDYRTRR